MNSRQSILSFLGSIFMIAGIFMKTQEVWGYEYILSLSLIIQLAWIIDFARMKHRKSAEEKSTLLKN